MPFENWYRNQDVVLGIVAFNVTQNAFLAGVAEERERIAKFLDSNKSYRVERDRLGDEIRKRDEGNV